MSGLIQIAACGFMDTTGFGNHRVRHAWRSRGEPAELRWSRVSEAPFDRFGRLDPLCKCALAAVEMLDLPPVPDGVVRSDMAILLGTAHGSRWTDAEFFRTTAALEGASPLLFTYTLPSTAIGEIAIRHRIGGPCACFMGGPESGLLALWESVHLIREGEADSCVCVACDAPGPLAERCGYACLVEKANAAMPDRPALARLTINPPELPAQAGDAASPPRGLRDVVRFAIATGRGGPDMLYLRPHAVTSALPAGGAICVTRSFDARTR